MNPNLNHERDRHLLESEARRIGDSSYFITDDGRVWSDANRQHKGKWLALQPHPKGYIYVKLWGIGTAKVHRLVAGAFIPNPLRLPQVNHLNGIKSDNRASNLEWCDNRHNVRHAWANGVTTMNEKRATHLASISRAHNAAKRALTMEQAREIRERVAAGETIHRVAKSMQILHATASQIARGITYRES